MVGTAVPLTLRIKELHPPEVDGGGGIDTTVMANGVMRTMAPKSLLTFGKLSMLCQYDPGVYGQFFPAAFAAAVGVVPAGTAAVIAPGNPFGGFINVIGVFTVLFPDGATFVFNGWINKFTPSNHKEGDFPTAEVEIIPSNTSIIPVAGFLSHDVLPIVAPGASPGLVVR